MTTPITRETRDEGYRARPASRKTEILEAMGYGTWTARAIAIKLGYTDMNAVRPRLTELVDEGKVEVIGKKKDTLTGVSVACFKRIWS